MERLRILSVDADEDVRLIISLSLGLDAFVDARIVATLDEAVAVLDDAAWIPDCVSLEAITPGSVPSAVYHAVRTHPQRQNTKVVILTSAVDRKSLAAYLTLGAWGIISKPFDPLALARQFRVCLSGGKALAA